MQSEVSLRNEHALLIAQKCHPIYMQEARLGAIINIIVLIAITPQRTISFILKAWGGRTYRKNWSA